VNLLAASVTATVPVDHGEPLVIVALAVPACIVQGRVAKFSFMVDATMSVPAVKTFLAVI
jgi:hypothetical protein